MKDEATGAKDKSADASKSTAKILNSALIVLLAALGIFVLFCAAICLAPVVRDFFAPAKAPPQPQSVTLITNTGGQPAPAPASAAPVPAANIDDQKKLLDTLITLVSLYTTLLAAGAYFNMKSLKERIEKETDDAKQQLEEDTQKAETKLAEFQKRIEADFPAMARLNQRFHDHVSALLGWFPDDMNFSHAMDSLTRDERQRSFLMEYLTAAIDIFSHTHNSEDRQNFSDIQLAFARYYLSQGTQKGHMDAEIRLNHLARARIYADRAIGLGDAHNVAIALRSRGVIGIEEYLRLKINPAEPATERLRQAIGDLRMAMEKDPDDGRAYYNLSIAYLWQGKREENARNFTNEKLAVEQLTTYISRKKSLHDYRKNCEAVYANLANAYALWAGKSSGEDKTALQEKAVMACRQGKDAADELGTVLRQGAKAFQEMIEDELKPEGDLRTNLEPKQLQKIENLFDDDKTSPESPS